METCGILRVEQDKMIFSTHNAGKYCGAVILVPQNDGDAIILKIGTLQNVYNSSVCTVDGAMQLMSFNMATFKSSQTLLRSSTNR